MGPKLAAQFNPSPTREQILAMTYQDYQEYMENLTQCPNEQRIIVQPKIDVEEVEDL